MTSGFSGVPFDQQASTMRSLAIEGWRGINHSIALVNQHQILELLKLPGLKLFHQDLPYAYPTWTRAANTSGFPAHLEKLVDDLAPPGEALVDCVYRIGSPTRACAADDRRKTVTYMITELGVSHRSFEDGAGGIDVFTRGENRITTPTRWSRDRLVEWGFPGDKIDLIAHGFDPNTFGPISAAQKQANRQILGIRDDETLFLNVGLPTWNKGIDVLLVAFATMRAAGRKVRLILKDQQELYGRSVRGLIETLAPNHPALTQADTLGAITVISSNITPTQLHALFASVDCYVSPYRAEGFNLPVLEAIACGTPVIVTKGGATDDFCDDDVALRISGTMGQLDDAASGLRGRYIEPNMSELLEAMDCFASRRSTILNRFDEGRVRAVNRFTWADAALRLARLTVGYDDARVAVEPDTGGVRRPDLAAA